MLPQVGPTADPNAIGGGHADPNRQKADKTRVRLGRHIEVALRVPTTRRPKPAPNARADSLITD